MKTKKSFIICILVVLSSLLIKAQKTDLKYSFKQQVQNICNDSTYNYLEIIINNYVITNPYNAENIKKDVLPLDFLTWKNPNEIKNERIDDIGLPLEIINKNSSHYNGGGKGLDFIVLSKNYDNDLSFSIYTNNYNVKVKRYENGNNALEYNLNTFSVSKDVYLSEMKAQLNKTFSSKSHVFANDFIETCDKCYIRNITYYNKSSFKLKNRKNKFLIFDITIFDLVEKKENEEPILISRKIILKGDKGKAIDYLKKNKLNHQEVSPEKIKEQDFKDLD